MLNANLDTLEVVGPRPNYLDYWPKASTSLGLPEDDVRKTVEMGSYVTRLTDNVIRGADPNSVGLMSNIITGEAQAPTISNAVAEWDRSLGPQNRLGDAQPDILRAAGLLLRANFLGHPYDFRTPAEGTGRTMERFMDLLSRNPMETQAPSASLLLVGELIHKAGMIELDPVLQEMLFEKATEVYEYLHTNKRAAWQDRLKAGQLRADIYHEWLRQELQASTTEGSDVDPEDIMDTAVELQQEQMIDLRAMGRLAECDVDHDSDSPDDTSNVDNWSGFMLEGFALLAARDRLLFRQPDTSAASLFGVRRSFAHEDEPRTLRLKPKTSFDIVVVRHNREQKPDHATPIQIKNIGKRRERKRPVRRYENSYAVPVICVKRCSPNAVIIALDDLAIAYEERNLQRNQGLLHRVQTMLGRYMVDGPELVSN